MNSDQFEGKWKQFKGKAKEQWGKLTDDDIQMINGKRDTLIGKLQERYGYAREEAQKRADEWMASVHDQDVEYAQSGPKLRSH
ncbi:MAG: CsbD family protein [Bryobacterales bacterium]|nr:CsbD family protein [Bryobacterales bacterium]MBV9397389.1 CsbD family protein [Bryobacterales bacterium]